MSVHFQYCFLAALRAVSERLQADAGEGLSFSGRFEVAAPDRLGVPAAHNLGSHLMAIRRRLYPRARLGRIVTGYEARPRRAVALRGGGALHRVDFSANREPLVQRFVAAYERSLSGGGPLFDLAFAYDVRCDCASLEAGPA